MAHFSYVLHVNILLHTLFILSFNHDPTSLGRMADSSSMSVVIGFIKPDKTKFNRSKSLYIINKEINILHENKLDGFPRSNGETRRPIRKRKCNT